MRFRDAEALSAYLDHQLSDFEAARIEKRLAADADLRAVLNDLRLARGLVRQTPRRRAPRDFTLRATDQRVTAPQPRAVPMLRLAGALASMLFVAAAAANALSPLDARTLTEAPAPAFGVGGGGGPGEAEPPEESLALSAPADTAPVEPTVSAQEGLMPLAPGEPSPKQSSPEVQNERHALNESQPPIDSRWLWLLAFAGILLLGSSIYLDRISKRNFRRKWLEK
jgi:hypothetical protein